MGNDSNNGRNGNPGRSEPEREGSGSLEWLTALGGALLVLGPLLGRAWRFLAPQRSSGRAEGIAAEKSVRDHERRDANAAWIFGMVGFLLVFGISIHFILAGMLKSLNGTAGPSDLWRPSQPPQEARKQGGAFPVLQVSAPADLKHFRAREEESLNTYGWIDRTSGVVRVPIERAMELVLQEGLPTRTGSNADRSGPSTYQLIQQRPDHRQREIQGKQ